MADAYGDSIRSPLPPGLMAHCSKLMANSYYSPMNINSHRWVGAGVVLAAIACAACGQDTPGAQGFTLPAGQIVDLSHAYDAEAIFWPTAAPFHLEVVADGRTGLLFDPHKPAELAAQLDRILGNAALAAGLAIAARQQVTANYDLGALVADEIALLKRVAHPG